MPPSLLLASLLLYSPLLVFFTSLLSRALPISFSLFSLRTLVLSLAFSFSPLFAQIRLLLTCLPESKSSSSLSLLLDASFLHLLVGGVIAVSHVAAPLLATSLQRHISPEHGGAALVYSRTMEEPKIFGCGCFLS